jgi:hypothetical protein
MNIKKEEGVSIKDILKIISENLQKEFIFLLNSTPYNAISREFEEDFKNDSSEVTIKLKKETVIYSNYTYACGVTDLNEVYKAGQILYYAFLNALPSKTIISFRQSIKAERVGEQNNKYCISFRCAVIPEIIISEFYKLSNLKKNHHIMKNPPKINKC